MLRLAIVWLITICSLLAPVRAEVTTTFNYSQWQSMVGDYSTIDFTGFADGIPISNQYTSLGVTFTGPSFIFASVGFLDGWGLHGPSGLHLYFDQPQSWIAVHHAGNAFFKLYHQGNSVGTGAYNPVGGIGSFVGVTSTIDFDEVIITKPAIDGTHIFVDDLHWGVPSPGAIGLFLIAGLRSRRRRR